jgi:hypothetical protein
VKTPVVLIDDPRANEQFDLKRTLASWGGGLLGVIEPLPGGAPGETAVAAEGLLGKNDSETTRSLKTAQVRYRLSTKDSSSREFEAAAGPQVLRQLGTQPFLLVGYVSAATFPLFMACATQEGTRDFLRVGITGVRMDGDYNLARKLIVDGGIAYHEHTRTLEKVLCRRLELMLTAHHERQRSAGG